MVGWHSIERESAYFALLVLWLCTCHKAWEVGNNPGVRHSGSVILLDLSERQILSCLAAAADWCFRARTGRIDRPSDKTERIHLLGRTTAVASLKEIVRSTKLKAPNDVV